MPLPVLARPRSIRRDALTIFILCLTVYLAFAKGRPWTEATLQTQRGRLLVEQHTLGSPAPFGDIDIRGRDGRYYDAHGLLNTLVHLPFVAFDRWLPAEGEARKLMSDFIASMSGSVLNSLSVMVFYLLVRAMSLGRRASLIAAAALAFGTMVFPYAGTNYEGNADLVCLLLSAHYCFAFLRDSSEGRARHLRWCGVWCGLSLLGRESNFLMVGLIGLAVLWDAWRTKQVAPIVSLLAAMLPFAALLGWYNLIRTGSPFETAIMHDIAAGRYPFFHATSPYGVLALLASPGGSIFVYSPMAFLALFGMRDAWRRFPRETTIAGAFTIVTLVSSGIRARWFGFASWGPRYAIPVLPFLLIALAVWLDKPGDRQTTRRHRALVAALFVPALAMQLTGALVNWHSRLGNLVSPPRSGEEVHWSPLIFSIRGSQWWDALSGLAANVRYMITGRYSAEAVARFSAGLSPSSLYTSMTLDTWWNRAMFEGVSPILVTCYLAASAAIVAACVVSLREPPAVSQTR